MPTYAEGFRKRVGNVSRAIGRRASIVSNMFRRTRRNTNSASVNPMVNNKESSKNSRSMNDSRRSNNLSKSVNVSRRSNSRSKSVNASIENISIVSEEKIDKESAQALMKILQNFQKLHKINSTLNGFVKNNPSKKIDVLVKSLFPTDKGSSYLNNTSSTVFLNFVFTHGDISLEWDEFIENIERLIPLNYISESGIRHIQYFCKYWMKKIIIPKIKKLSPKKEFEKWLYEHCKKLLFVINKKEDNNMLKLLEDNMPEILEDNRHKKVKDTMPVENV